MRKKIGIMAVAVVLIFVYVVGFKEEEITNSPSTNSGVVAFGDSLVEGVGSARGGGFVRMLSEDFDLAITNLGRSGDTTGDALGRIDQLANIRPAVTIVLLGGNDYLRRVERGKTLANLDTIIEVIHGSGSAVLLVGLEKEIFGGADSKLFEKLVKDNKTAYVPDILDGIFGDTELMSDELHPNDAGYRIMADRIKPILKKLLIE